MFSQPVQPSKPLLSVFSVISWAKSKRRSIFAVSLYIVTSYYTSPGALVPSFQTRFVDVVFERVCHLLRLELSLLQASRVTSAVCDEKAHIYIILYVVDSGAELQPRTGKGSTQQQHCCIELCAGVCVPGVSYDSRDRIKTAD
jgi:hypothetical protein